MVAVLFIAAIFLAFCGSLSGTVRGVPQDRPSDRIDTLEVAPVDTAAAANSTEANEHPDEDAPLEDAPLDGILEDDMDVAVASDEGADGYAHAQEILHDLAVWKLDLNAATSDELESLPGINSREAARLVAYREANGPFSRPSDLSKTGLSPETVAAILPYASVSRRPRLPVQVEILQRWSRRLTKTAGYRRDSTQARYLGTPDALLTRVKMKLGNRVVLGGVLEKDAGEPFGKDTRLKLGHDFAAGYVMISDLGPFRRIILGDFTSQAGEGLLFGQNARIGHGPRSMRIREFLRPHSSSREHAFFRGLAIHSRSLAGFYLGGGISRKSIDARYDSVAGMWNFSADGLHRTESERSRKQQAHEWVAAWTAGYRRGGLRIGFAGADTRRQVGAAAVSEAVGEETSYRTTPRATPTLSRLRSFTGYAAWSGSRLGLAAELAPRDSGLAASIALEYSPTRAAEIWLEGVRSTPGGESPHSSIAVDSRGFARRETTWSAGVLMRPSPLWSWSVVTQQRRRPIHPLQGASMSTSGTLEVRPDPWTTLRLRAVDQRNETLGACASPHRILRCAVRKRRQSLRLQIDYQHSRMLRHRFHVEVSRGTAGAGLHRRGILLYKDVRWRWSRVLQIDARLLYFDVTDFEARIYAFENDLLYSFSAPVYSGRGRRSYVLLRCAPHERVLVQLKYGLSAYEDVHGVGSGLDATSEPVRKDVRIQLRWKIGERLETRSAPVPMVHLV